MMPRMMSRSGPAMLARMVVMSEVLSDDRTQRALHVASRFGGSTLGRIGRSRLRALGGAAPVDAGAGAGVVDGVLAAGAVAFGGAVTALKFVPSTTLTSAS